MTLQQLLYFKTCAELKHFTDASVQLHISQPSLSYAISNLEKELGVMLFAKQGRNVILTPFGEEYLVYVNQALSILEEGRSRIQKMAAKEAGTINISYITAMGIAFIPSLINAFQAHAGRLSNKGTSDITQELHFNLFQNHSKNQQEILLNGTCDLAFGSYFDSQSLEFKCIYCEDIYLAVSTQHHLAKRSSVCFDDFRRERLITFQHPSNIRRQIEGFYAEHGEAPHIHSEVTNEIMIAGLIAKEPAVALLPAIQGANYQNVKLLPITDCSIKRPLYIIRKRGSFSKPIAEDLWDFTIQHTHQLDLFKPPLPRSLP